MPKPVEFHQAFARALEGVSPRAVTLDRTGSTMDDARALARDGAPHLTVVVTDFQARGRGRRGRAWVSPPGLGLQASWVVRPSLPVERWTLVPLIAGVAAVDAIGARTGVAALLKWPNDLLFGDRKLGGILVEAEPPDFCVVGCGLNVNHTDLPPEYAATSIALAGGTRLDRADLLAHILAAFDALLREPDAALARYRALCATLGRRVRVERAHDAVTGVARDVDDRGALVLEDGTTIASGDVQHLRDV